MARPRFEYLSDADKQFVHEQTRARARGGRRRLQHADADGAARRGRRDRRRGAPARPSCRGSWSSAASPGAPATSCWPAATPPTTAGRRRRHAVHERRRRHLHARRPHRRAPRGHATADLAHDDAPVRRRARDRLHLGDHHARRRRLRASATSRWRASPSSTRASTCRTRCACPTRRRCSSRCSRPIAGAPLRERPIWSVTNCTIAPLQHDARDDRGAHPHGQGRLPHLRAAHAADGHDRADERARHQHPQHGRAAERRSSSSSWPSRAARWSRRSARRSPRCAAVCTSRGRPRTGSST